MTQRNPNPGPGPMPGRPTPIERRGFLRLTGAAGALG
jgi:hypothetical protein